MENGACLGLCQQIEKKIYVEFILLGWGRVDGKPSEDFKILIDS